MWNEFGFKSTLYNTKPIEGNEQGERLLVGRSAELRRLVSRLSSYSNIPTIEGPNGVGKTSLALVAAYKASRGATNSGKSSLFVLPDSFQISPNDTAASFKRTVYFKIANYIISNESSIREKTDFQVNLSPLKAWLTRPIGMQGGAGAFGLSFSAGMQPIDTAGYSESGFYTEVESILRQTFDERGGLVCCIDNLEILREATRAKSILEEMRDDLLNRHGVKWIICGARGIVRSVAGTPRLQGRLLEPIEVNPLNLKSMPDLISARVNEFKTQENAIPPVDDKRFAHLYNVLNENLRDTLRHSEDFSHFLFEDHDVQISETGIGDMFENWIDETSKKFYMAITRVAPRAWQLFDELCAKEGAVRASDYSEFGFNQQQGMRTEIVKLETNGLVSSEIDEGDSRKKTITVSAKGWLVNHARKRSSGGGS